MRRIISVLATLVLACGLLLTSPGTASAAPHHHGTLPYPTGCGRNAVVISRQNMAGGTASVVYSRTCGTNWIEWYGPAIYTYKTLHAGGRWAGYEEDYTGWDYVQAQAQQVADLAKSAEPKYGTNSIVSTTS